MNTLSIAGRLKKRGRGRLQEMCIYLINCYFMSPLFLIECNSNQYKQCFALNEVNLTHINTIYNNYNFITY
jgi:hypothetical protein